MSGFTASLLTGETLNRITFNFQFKTGKTGVGKAAVITAANEDGNSDVVTVELLGGGAEISTKDSATMQSRCDYFLSLILSTTIVVIFSSFL